MQLPKARGDLSQEVFDAMHRPSPEFDGALNTRNVDEADLQIALWALYELHYGGFDDVADDLEWHPGLLDVRRGLERRFEATLRDRFQEPVLEGPFSEAFFGFVGEHDGPSLANFIQREASHEQVMDFVKFRSIYHLKEADPTAWTVPRLPTRAKAAVMELQYDEYGAGDPNRLHAHLFRRGLLAAGLRGEYGAYIDDAPVEVLAQNNAMSLFGLHRRLRGAALGHLAAFETTSSQPSRRLAQGLGRIGAAAELIAYYEEHVEADSVHEQLAVRTICQSLIEDEPEVRSDVMFGAFTCLDLEDRFAAAMLESWAS